MNYREAIKYLEGSAVLGSKKGLSDFKTLLGLMGSPEKQENIIHVAGTNGKGSFCAYTDNILRAAGYTTGVFTSPHLVKYNERISLCGEYISDDDFAGEITYVRDKIREFYGNKEGWFSFFEIMTAAALHYFAEKKPDFIILETGLGGRLDATNAVEKPLFTAITKIARDHMQYLGDTPEQIAFEKAGIIKPGIPCVLYPYQPEIYPVIRIEAAKKSAPLRYDKHPKFNIIKKDLEGTVFGYGGKYLSYEGLETVIPGAYQLPNIATVLAGIYTLRKQGFEIPDEAVYEGVRNTRVKGRMEKLSEKPLIFADGAHNIDGAKMFSMFTGEIKEKYGKITLIAGALEDKDPIRLIRKLAENADRVILTRPDSKRAFDPKNLSLDNDIVIYKENLKNALDEARCYDDGIIFIAGSLYLVGEAKIILEGEADK